MTDYISVVDTAKLVRKDLKKAFPCVKFSVRSDKYSMGSSIRVRWTNGPSDEEVKKIAGHYHGAEFDGMQDLKSYNNKPYCNDYIFFERTITEDHYIKEAAKVIKEYGLNINGMSVNDALDFYDTEIYHRLGVVTLRNFCYRNLCIKYLEDIPEEEEEKEAEPVEEVEETPVYQEASPEFIEAVDNIIMQSLDVKVKMDPSDIQAFCKNDFNYNAYNNWNVGKMCREIDAMTPKINARPGNPNNGMMHHNYYIGREASMCLYVDITKAYMDKGHDWDKYADELKTLAINCFADECEVVENSEYTFKYRMWWD